MTDVRQAQLELSKRSESPKPFTGFLVNDEEKWYIAKEFETIHQASTWFKTQQGLALVLRNNGLVFCAKYI